MAPFEDAVAVVDVLRGQPWLEDDALLQVVQAGGRGQLVEDRPAVGGKQPVPVVVRAEIGRVDQDVEGLAAGRGDVRLGPRPGRRRSRSGRRPARPGGRWRRTPRAGRGRRRSCGAAGGRSAGRGRGRARRPSRPARTAAAARSAGRPGRRAVRDGSAPSRRSRRPRPARSRSPSSVSTPATAPCRPSSDAAGRRRRSAARRRASSARPISASGTARVPPRGYQTPSPVCMCGDPAQHGRRSVGRRADVLREVVEHLGDARLGHVRPHGRHRLCSRPHAAARRPA